MTIRNMKKGGFTYILTNKYNTVLYVGVTDNLIKRTWEHSNKTTDGFTKKYNISKLVYYELHSTIEEAIVREKYIKGKKRIYKIGLIQSMNPEWNDLYDSIK